jgi:lysophospholipase L1-like esterase
LRYKYKKIEIMIKNFKWLLLVSLAFAACNKNDEEIVTVSNSSDGKPLTAGTADFSKYVALGDSFAAGYSDGALFVDGQKGAYPNVMAEQFGLVGGGAFSTPLMNDNIGGFLVGGVQMASQRLYFDGKVPVPVVGQPTTEITTKLTGTFNNMGIPGAKSFHLGIAGYGTLNPYFGRFASMPTAKVINDAVAQKPTFFSLWIGGNDVLSYALSGGTGVNQTGNYNPATYGSNDITDPTVFANTFTGLVAGLTAGGAKGVVANLPYVNALPFFTTIPTKPVAPYSYFIDGDEELKSPVISPGDVATINALNAQLYGPMNMILAKLNVLDRIDVLSTTTANPLLIKDESLEDLSAKITFVAQNSGNPQLVALAPYLGLTFGKVRQTKTGDLIPLTTKAAIGSAATLPPGVPNSLGKYGITYPLEDKHALIPLELTEIKTATDAYNATIKSVALDKKIAFVDTKSMMDQLVNGGITSNSFTMTNSFVTGGAFSLDGVHPSPRGYALIANKFLEAINATYGSNLKGVDLSNYRILYPAKL